MANFTITITNRVNLLGGGPPSLWGTMRWGSSLWGNSADNIEAVDKLVANSLGSTSTIATATDFVPAATTDILSLSSTITSASEIIGSIISDILAFSSDITVEVLSNGVWNYVFPGQVTNSNDRISTNYAAATSPSSSWAEVTHPSTIWS